MSLCRFSLFTYEYSTVLVFVIVAKLFGQSPFLKILRIAFSKLRHSHVALWPVSRVLVALSFEILVVKQTAHIFIFESWNFRLEDINFTGKNLDNILLPVCLCFQ